MGANKKLDDRYTVKSKRFQLQSIDPEESFGIKSREEATARLEQLTEELGELQERLYAQDSWSVLVILQGMDAAGKDGVVKYVLSGINPAGCQVFSFKAPNDEELDHDFLWRATRSLPERGRIGIFNRSYYEEVVTVRVHPEFLIRQRLPERLVSEEIFDERMQDIVAYERYLARNGVLIRKFFLHVSRDEQKKRFLERIDEPEKNWKFNSRDVAERAHWEDYQGHWSDAMAKTSTVYAPWIIVPADKKWFTRLVIAESLVSALHELELDFPKIDAARKSELAAARKKLLSEER